ncbi:hypothetical protein [Mycolicibacterium conceptionense]|uniref:Uncharacterized protein n=1 Tax=Mycolicibacterium conceptionense TaxID=451644 RepID=A0A1A1ZKU6_9MYCO|nr:hypothetical protein [Mycolicibacterium conceptionense]OBF23089.1 hypothetical protein A5726_12290 [Mycolicibacterium conceptionense]OBF44201.1 hypothetical protein A5720_00115 [Mycolicibacterium conceptionense]OBH92674.1 hypothetical protein A5716_28640 [Mycolicibacterium conceptionense]
MWPWKRRIADAERKLAEAEARNRGVEQLAAQARQATHALRRESDLNGWTELFLASMQRGH